jgi:hypothetical protein
MPSSFGTPDSKVVKPNRVAAKRRHECPVGRAILGSYARRQWFIRRSSWLLYYHASTMMNHNGGGNDQVDCCCWFCFSCHDIGASNDTRADSSAGWHDHASRLGLRAGQDKDRWSLRVQSCHPPATQVSAMDRTHLRSVGLVKTRHVTLNDGPAFPPVQVDHAPPPEIKLPHS